MKTSSNIRSIHNNDVLVTSNYRYIIFNVHHEKIISHHHKFSGAKRMFNKLGNQATKEARFWAGSIYAAIDGEWVLIF